MHVPRRRRPSWRRFRCPCPRTWSPCRGPVGRKKEARRPTTFSEQYLLRKRGQSDHRIKAPVTPTPARPPQHAACMGLTSVPLLVTESILLVRSEKKPPPRLASRPWHWGARAAEANVATRATRAAVESTETRMLGSWSWWLGCLYDERAGGRKRVNECDSITIVVNKKTAAARRPKHIKNERTITTEVGSLSLDAAPVLQGARLLLRWPWLGLFLASSRLRRRKRTRSSPPQVSRRGVTRSIRASISMGD